MKVRDLTVDYIMSLDEDALFEVKWMVRPALSSSRKNIKAIKRKGTINSKIGAKEYLAIHKALAHQEMMMEAILCRQDELYGAGVLSTYDHSEQFC